MKARPSRRVGFGDRSQFFPREIRVDRHNIGGWRAGEFCIAAVDRPPHSAHQGHYPLARLKPAVCTVLDEADALDSTDRRRFGPVPAAHMCFRLVDPERPDLDEYVACVRLWIRQLLNGHDFRTAKRLPGDGSHLRFSYVLTW